MKMYNVFSNFFLKVKKNLTSINIQIGQENLDKEKKFFPCHPIFAALYLFLSFVQNDLFFIICG